MFYLIYSLLFFFIGLLIVTYNINSKIAHYWYYFGIVLFWGLAYHYAVDTANYMQYFYCEVTPIWKGVNLSAGDFEAGFNLVAHLCKTISSEYVFFQMVLFGTIMILIIKGFEKLFDEKTLLLIIPLLFFLYPKTMSALRQGVAIALFIYALQFINEKRSWRYFICILIAIFFHQSAIFLFVVYFARYMKGLLSKNWLILGVLIVCDVLWLLGISISNNISFIADFLSEAIDMGDKYVELYMYDDNVRSEAGFAKLVEVNVTVVLFTLLCPKDKQNELLRFNLVLYVVFMLAFGGLFAHRLIYYFNIPYYICFIQGMMALTNNRITKKIKYTDRMDVMLMVGYTIIAVYMIWFHVLHSDLIQRDYLFLPTNMIEITNHNYDLL